MHRTAQFASLGAEDNLPADVDQGNILDFSRADLHCGWVSAALPSEPLSTIFEAYRWEVNPTPGLAPGGLPAVSAGCRFELVELRVTLGGKPSIGSLAIEFRAGAVIERGVLVDPDLDGWVS